MKVVILNIKDVSNEFSDIAMNDFQPRISKHLDTHSQECTPLFNQINYTPEIISNHGIYDVCVEENKEEMLLETQVSFPNVNDHSTNRKF
jgi:hypothetical protein